MSAVCGSDHILLGTEVRLTRAERVGRPVCHDDGVTGVTRHTNHLADITRTQQTSRDLLQETTQSAEEQTGKVLGFINCDLQ